MNKITRKEPKNIYKLAWVIGPTYRDEPNIEFANASLLVHYVLYTYPDYTQFDIICTRKPER